MHGFAAKSEVVSDEVTAVGTPLYMSPESIRSPDSVEPRSDIYAVGTVAYYLLTGAQVFEGTTVSEIFEGHLTKTPSPPSQRVSAPIPPALDALILACLAKDVADRPACAFALREALRACEGIGQWTQADAKAWWGSYRSAPSSGQAAPSGEAEVTRTIRLDVDLKGRAAPPGQKAAAPLFRPRSTLR